MPKSLKRKRKTKHSKAGREFLQYGEKGFEELSKTRQKTARLKRKVAAIGPTPHDPSETKTQKERGGYISPSSGSGSGGMSSYSDWLNKRGKGATVNTRRQYRSEKRNVGR